ncbi:MAG: MBL fold metallo-hydrolase [Polyangiales bacterium]
MTFVVLAVVVALIVALIAEKLPRVSPASGDLKLHTIAPDIHFYRGYFSNSVVFVLPRGVLVVDSQVSPRAAKRLRDEIAAITDKPVRWVVNTHYHGDHTGGNAVFPEAEIIATDLCARYVVERDEERIDYASTFGLEFVEIHPTIGPTKTFNDALILDLDGERIEILQIGRCETPDACVVHWPARRVVAAGDGVPTVDYPYNGVPLLDEGLRDDGEWIRFLNTIRKWRPELLLAGHGPALVGEQEIANRLELLAELFSEMMRVTKEERARGGTLQEMVDRIDARLDRYNQNPQLRQYTVSQRFLIYRCLNNTDPARKGKGWWHDLRPSVIHRASVEEARSELATVGRPHARAAALASRNRPLAITMLETWLAEHPEDAAAWGLLSDIFLDGSSGVKPTVDATEFFVAATKAAKRALAIDPEEPLGLLNLGSAEIFGGMVLAQDMSGGIDKLERALKSGALNAKQRGKAEFFIGKGHQHSLRWKASDHHFRRALPLPLRPFYPLLRDKIRAYP